MFNQYTQKSIGAMGRQMEALGDSVDNIGNSFTVGYKVKRTSFHETVKGLRQNTVRDFTDGVSKKTNRELDFAIQGKGFFEVQLPDGTVAYTRDGSFKLGPDGELLSSQGYPLVNKQVVNESPTSSYDSLTRNESFNFEIVSSSIRVPTGSSVILNDKGEILTDKGDVLGQLNVVTFINSDGLRDIGNSLFVPGSESGNIEEIVIGKMEGETQIKQGHLETSNLTIVDDMARVTQLNSAIKAQMKVVKLLDGMQESLNSTITRNI